MMFISRDVTLHIGRQLGITLCRDCDVQLFPDTWLIGSCRRGILKVKPCWPLSRLTGGPLLHPYFVLFNNPTIALQSLAGCLQPINRSIPFAIWCRTSFHFHEYYFHFPSVDLKHVSMDSDFLHYLMRKSFELNGFTEKGPLNCSECFPDSPSNPSWPQPTTQASQSLSLMKLVPTSESLIWVQSGNEYEDKWFNMWWNI